MRLLKDEDYNLVTDVPEIEINLEYDVSKYKKC
jgi:hypothetical protein